MNKDATHITDSDPENMDEPFDPFPNITKEEKARIAFTLTEKQLSQSNAIWQTLLTICGILLTILSITIVSLKPSFDIISIVLIVIFLSLLSFSCISIVRIFQNQRLTLSIQVNIYKPINKNYSASNFSKDVEELNRLFYNIRSTENQIIKFIIWCFFLLFVIFIYLYQFTGKLTTHGDKILHYFLNFLY